MKVSIWTVENEQHAVSVQVAKAGRAKMTAARAMKAAKLVYPDVRWHGAYWETNAYVSIKTDRDLVILDED